jgi:septum formation topological specificity factor MinE
MSFFHAFFTESQKKVLLNRLKAIDVEISGIPLQTRNDLTEFTRFTEQQEAEYRKSVDEQRLAELKSELLSVIGKDEFVELCMTEAALLADCDSLENYLISARKKVRKGE